MLRHNRRHTSPLENSATTRGGELLHVRRTEDCSVPRTRTQWGGASSSLLFYTASGHVGPCSATTGDILAHWQSGCKGDPQEKLFYLIKGLHLKFHSNAPSIFAVLNNNNNNVHSFVHSCLIWHLLGPYWRKWTDSLIMKNRCYSKWKKYSFAFLGETGSPPRIVHYFNPFFFYFQHLGPCSTPCRL